MELTPQEKAALLRLFPQGAIALDMEYTGLCPFFHSIIELAAVKITPNDTQIFNQRIRPPLPIPEDSSCIHGITNEMVKDAPSIEQVLPSFMDFLDKRPLIAHNARFDTGFLVCNLHRQKIPFSDSSIFCSVNFARKAFPQMPNFKLATLQKELNLGEFKHHQALDDAWACLRIFTNGLAAINNPSLAHPVLKHSYLFRMSEFNNNPDFLIPQHLHPIRQYIEQQTEVEIKYNGGSMKNQFRPVRPISFLPLPQGNALYALCLTSNVYKFYSLKKITEIRIK